MFQPQILLGGAPLVPSRDFCRPVTSSVTKGKRPKSVSHTLSWRIGGAIGGWNVYVYIAKYVDTTSSTFQGVPIKTITDG